MKGLNSEGAPGLDSPLFEFFKEFWSLMEVDIMGTLEKFRRGSANLDQLNKSHLFMLPKHARAENVGDY